MSALPSRVVSRGTTASVTHVISSSFQIRPRLRRKKKRSHALRPPSLSPFSGFFLSPLCFLSAHFRSPSRVSSSEVTGVLRSVSMVVSSSHAASAIGFEGTSNMPTSEASSFPSSSPSSSSPSSRFSSDFDMGFGERALSAAGAAVLSAVIVNPLDVAKTRLQAQAAGVPYHPLKDQLGSYMASSSTNKYKGTLDVLYKVIRQEGFARLWRGTNASLALAVPTVGIYLPCYDIFRNWIEEFTAKNSPNLTPYAPLVAGSVARSLACIACSPIELARTRMQAFKESRTGAKPPGMWKTLLRVRSPFRSTKYLENLQGYRVLWTGVGAQLARDVPFSAICWSILEPIRRRLLELTGGEGNVGSVIVANFSAGFVAGSLAAAATCPLDVVKTQRQIEKDPARVLNMTTRQTLVEIWRRRGTRGLFAGVGPRVGRAGPSVGIVISFYEVVKYILHQRHINSMEKSVLGSEKSQLAQEAVP